MKFEVVFTMENTEGYNEKDLEWLNSRYYELSILYEQWEKQDVMQKVLDEHWKLFGY
ncbi:hypothetical protein KO361_05340 [Candidatus Woesearchaeota archaeon]|nr:hypothetical protein [Candidatus Woesearchaeota archaeon]